MAQCTYMQNPAETREGQQANHSGLFPFSVLPSAYFLSLFVFKRNNLKTVRLKFDLLFLILLMNFFFWQHPCDFYTFYFTHGFSSKQPK